MKLFQLQKLASDAILLVLCSLSEKQGLSDGKLHSNQNDGHVLFGAKDSFVACIDSIVRGLSIISHKVE